jgi:hypothetical protein
VRQGLAAGFLIAAVVSVAPQWWEHAAISAARWVARVWLAAILVLVAVALVAGRSRHRTMTMALGRRPRTPKMPLIVHVILLLGLAAAVAVAVGVLLWEVLGQPTPLGTPGPPTAGWTAQDRLDAVKVVLTVVGGVGAVVALTIAYRRQRLHEVDAYRDDSKVLLDRYGKAAELLGAPDASVRTAGVYAFAALANDAPEARQGCIDVLCAYLRQPYNPPSNGDVRTEAADNDAPSGHITADPAHPVRDPRQERQVRLTIIRLIRDNLHLPDDDPRTWRGHDFNFSGAVFDGGDFTGATFTGAGTVTFADTTIIGPLSFAEATFTGGIVSFDAAQFIGGTISLNGAKFNGGIVDLSRINKEQQPPVSDLWPPGTPVPAGLQLPQPQPQATQRQ